VAVDPVNGFVYVVEYLGNRVQRFNLSGSYLTQFANGKLYVANELAVNSAGDILIGDSGNNRVEVYVPT
jgi:DNA-binding beta-propeller fold protein YncE